MFVPGVTKKSMCKKQAEPMLKKNSTSDGNCAGGDAQSLQKGRLQMLMKYIFPLFLSAEWS
jgi:hypothetical protein